MVGRREFILSAIVVASGALPLAKSKLALAGAAVARFKVENELLDGISSAFLMMGADQKFGSEDGLELRIEPYDDPALAIEELLAGRADFAVGWPGPFFKAAEEGKGLRLVGTAMPRTNLLLFSRKQTGEIQDLVGKAVAIGPSASQSKALIRAALRVSNLDAGSVRLSFKKDYLGAISAAASGETDAAIAPVEYRQRALAGGELKVLLEFSEVLPDYLHSGIFASERSLGMREGELRSGLAAFVKGIRFAAQDLAKAAALAKSKTGLDDSQVEMGLRQYLRKGLVRLDLAIEARELQFSQSQNALDGGQKELLAPDKIFELRLQRAVVELLGGAQMRRKRC